MNKRKHKLAQMGTDIGIPEVCKVNRKKSNLEMRFKQERASSLLQT